MVACENPPEGGFYGWPGALFLTCRRRFARLQTGWIVDDAPVPEYLGNGLPRLAAAAGAADDGAHCLAVQLGAVAQVLDLYGRHDCHSPLIHRSDAGSRADGKA